VDVPWKYLNFFLEDDARLAHIGAEYGSGRMLTGEWPAASNVTAIEQCHQQITDVDLTCTQAFHWLAMEVPDACIEPIVKLVR
jgi:hypothetical protein